MKVHVIMAVHNRASLTRRCIANLCEAMTDQRIEWDLTVFDDGSTDTTVEVIKTIVPSAMIIQGDGTAFWARGMAIAESHALSESYPSDWILWLNDDVALDADWLCRCVRHMSEESNSVLVAAMRDRLTGMTSYSGFRRRLGGHPLRLQRVEPSRELQSVDTFNGNLVLVPAHVARQVGGIDGQFSHGLADLDYGLRCRAHDIPVHLMPGTMGECPRNSESSPRRLPDRWRCFIGVKGGGNPRSLRRYLRRHAKYTWPIFFASTYWLWFVRNVGPIARSRRSPRGEASV